jgi:hypothetical protein
LVLRLCGATTTEAHEDCTAVEASLALDHL